MSRHQKIRELLNFYVIAACQDIDNEDLFEEADDSSDEEEEEENELIMLGLTTLLGSRYLEERTNVIKSKDWYNNILPKYDDYRFKKIIRMDSMNFQKLV